MSDQLSPHERALLEALQRADTPDFDEQRRVKQRVFAELGLGAVGVTAATVASQLSHTATAAAAAANQSVATSAAGASVGAAGASTSAALGTGGAASSSSGGFAAALLAKVGTTPLVIGLTAALTTAGGTAVWWSRTQEVPQVTPPPAAVTAPSPERAEAAPVNPEPAAHELTAAPDEASKDHSHAADPVQSARRGANSNLEEEAQLLASAQQRISQGDARGALAVLARHRQRFPRGALSLERTATMAIAHCLSGETARGQSEAERFRRKHPNSPMVKRLESACKLKSQ